MIISVRVDFKVERKLDDFREGLEVFEVVAIGGYLLHEFVVLVLGDKDGGK